MEAYTALGALAAATERVQLGTLVTGNTYRNPTLLAKAITTLDVISQGRAILGIGAGWFELEHDQLGYEFGTFTDRFNKLNDALEIILPMIKGERPTVNGKYYRTREAMANPRFRDHIPLMIGGSGEKKTIPLAAKHFDHLNIIAGFDALPGKVKVVRERCEEIGRDPATLETSTLITVVVDDKATVDQLPEDVRGRTAIGTPGRDRRAGQDQGFRCGRHGHRLQHARLHPRCDRRRRRSAQAGAAVLTKLTGRYITDVDAPQGSRTATVLVVLMCPFSRSNSSCHPKN